MSESCKQALLLIAITVCLVLVLNPNALSSVQALGQRRSELPRRVLSQAEMQQFTTTANSGEIVMVGANGVLIDQGTQALRVGTSDVTILTNNLERLKVMNDGVVKINSTNTDALYWYDATTNNMIGGLGNSGGTDKGWVGLYDGATQKVALRANGVSTFTGGNVGIGLTNPGSKLDVVQSTENELVMSSAGHFSLSETTYGYVPVHKMAAYRSGTNAVTGEIGMQPIYDGSNVANPAGSIQFKVNSPASASNSWGQVANTTVMTLNGWGNVGIGTTIPTYLLELSNPTGNSSQPFMRIGNTVGGNSSHKVGIILAPFTGTTAGGTNTPYSGQSSQIAAIDDGAASSHLTFWTTPAMAATPAVERMRITNSGSVGIGVTNPWSVSSLEVLRNITFRPETFTVGGQVNTWYKVKIVSPVHAAARFSITRGINQDGPAEGSMSLEAEFRSRNCGNESAHLAWKYNQFSPVGRYFVARVSVDEAPDGNCSGSSCYVYLLGARSYSFSGINCAIEHFSADGTSPGTINTLTTRDEPFASSPYSCSSDGRTGLYSRNGNVGIHISNPQAPLHVNGYSTLNTGQRTWFGKDGSINTWGDGGFWVGIYADQGIISNTYLAAVTFSSWSDIRIKKNIRLKTGLLDIASRINLYSYDHIDVMKGNVEVGIIAQEVREIMPSTVNYTSEFLPNIYKEASGHLSSGDVVRLYVENKTSEEDELKMIIQKDDKEDSHTCKIINSSSEWIDVKKWDGYSASQRVLVYGTKDKEVLSVDKVQLGMVALGGVKELAVENKQLKQQIQDLHTRLSRLESLLSR